MTKILIIEDVAALRQHAAKLAEQLMPGAETLLAPSAQEGMKLGRSMHPDLIIMDISMPELNGIKAAQQIWVESPSQKILFWSQYHREAYIRELGKIVPDEAIHGYVLKSENDEKLGEAIKSILLNGNPYIDPIVRGVQAKLRSKDDSLTDSEYETLIDIAVGLTDKAIAKRRHISVRGVQNRLSILLDKLVKGTDDYLRESAGMEIYNPRTRIVFEALKRGLLDPDDLRGMEESLQDWLSDEFDVAAN